MQNIPLFRSLPVLIFGWILICSSSESRAQTTPPVDPRQNCQNGATYNEKDGFCKGGKSTPTADQRNGTSRNKNSEDDHSECHVEWVAAKDACSPIGALVGDDSGEGAMMQAMMAGQGANMLGALQSMKSPSASVADQCQAAADLSKLSGLVNGAMGAACMSAAMVCTGDCEDSIKTLTQRKADNDAKHPERDNWEKGIKDARQHVNKCKVFKFVASSELQQAMQAAGNMLQSQNCVKQATLASATPIPIPTPSDCSDPNYARVTLSCICATNPRDPQCAGSFGSPGIVSNGGVGAGTRKSGASTNGNLAGDGPGAGDPAFNPHFGEGGKPAPGGNEGGGGAGMPFGANSAAQAAANPEDYGAGAAPSGSGAGIIQGVASGSGGGFSYGKGSSGGGGDGGAKSMLQALKDKFNLKGLLPNKNDYAARGLAGMSVGLKDGITGANGPSIWEKVTRQYQNQHPQLLPP